MGENTKIEWCHHTFNPWGLSRWLRIAPETGSMCEAVAPFTKGDAVPHVKSQFWVLHEWPNMVSIQIAAIGAHLRAAFLRHALTFHRRDESSASLSPRLFDNFAAGVGHGR